MIKKTLTLLAFAAGIAIAGATPLTPAEALARLQSGENAPAKAATSLSAGLTLRQTVMTPDHQPAVYIFSGEGGKTLFVGADDLALPLLGYTDNDLKGELPPQLQWWLSEYAGQIGNASTLARSYRAPQAAPGGILPQQAPQTNRPALYNFIATKWNQDSPYNDLCPSVDNTVCPTGCVATAMAQVMKVHNHPEVGTGSISYVCNENSSSDDAYKGTLSLDFSTVHFDWANMLDEYTPGEYTEVEGNAVATLMRAAGYSVQMDYTKSSSGAVTAQTVNALKTYFGYNDAAKFVYRSSYSKPAWEQLIYDNIKTVGPVLLSGSNPASGGHAFVCDGYSEGMFHINWGWGGAYNGFFSLTALTPAGEGIGGNGAGDYSFNQGAGLNITTPDKPTITIEVADFTCSGSLEGSVEGNVLTLAGTDGFVVLNTSSETLVASMYIRLVASDGTDTFVIYPYTPTSFAPNTGFHTMTFNLPSTLANGTYEVYTAMLRQGESTPVDVAYIDGNSDHCLLTVNNGSYSVENLPAPEYTITGLTLDSKLFLHSDYRITYTISNNNDVALLDGIQPYFFTNGSTGVDVFGYSTARQWWLSAGESETFTQTADIITVNSNIPSGQVYLGLVSTNTGKILTAIPVTLNTTSTVGTVTLVSCDFKGDSSNANANDLQFNLSVKGATGYYADPVHIFIFPDGGGSSLANISSETLFVDVNQTVSTVVKGSFAGAQIGSSYIYIPYQGKGNSMAQLTNEWKTFTVTSDTSAVEGIDADGAEDMTICYDRQTGALFVRAAADLLAVDIYTTDGRKADISLSMGGNAAEASLEALPAGVYLISATAADGTVKSVKIVR